MTRVDRRRLCAALVVAATLASCGGDTVTSSRRARASRPPSPGAQSVPPQAAEGLPKCKKPKEVRYPDWVPDDLPLPEGTYAYKNLAPLGGYQRALFVLEISTQELIKLVLREWPKSGYTLGRGDAEPGEVEDDFRKPPAVGAFKANDVFCRPGYTVMYLIYAPGGPKGINILPSPTSSGTPLKS